MKPATNTLEELFRADVRYMVPLYQRPYVWKKDSHWGPLWQDLVDVVERQADPALGNASHFLGAVVLDHQQTNPGEIAQRLVIDGQQRLTTLQLLIAAVAAEAQAAGAEREARVLRKLTLNDADLASGDARFKVWPTNANRAAFRAVMATSSGSVEALDDPANTIQEAFEFFSTSARVWSRSAGSNHQVVVEQFDALRVALTSLLNLVSINLEPGDNAQVIFETLNARGTPLLAMDLVKNALFYRAAIAGDDTDALHDDWWQPQLGDEYWRQERRQGRLKRPRAELFLMHWLSMRLGRIVPATELFSEFRTQILDRTDPADIGALIRELCADAAVMRSFDDQPTGSPEARFFATLDALDTSTVIPVALALFKNSDVTVEQRRRALGAIESWLVRRMLAGLTSKNYNKTCADLLQAVRRRPDQAGEQIIDELAASSSAISVWPDDKTIAGVVVTRGMYGWVAQPRLVMVLSAIELSRRQTNNKIESVLTLPPKLTLEHLMPQKWRDSWSDPELDDDAARDVGLIRDAVVHRLGNLTLTSGPLNSSLSNNAWAVKAPALREHSLLALNSEVSALPSWDVEDIHRRGYALAREICAIWPSPADFGIGDPEEPLSLEQLLADAAVVAAAPSASSSDVQLATLLAAGFIEDGETLTAARAGVAATATVTGEGRLDCAGETFGTLSAAAVHAAGTKAENGWTFWLAERDGELVTLRDIRMQLAGASGRDADRHQMRRRYWASLLPIAGEITPLHNRVSPGPDTWIQAGAGWSGVHYIYETRQHAGGVKLYLEHRQAERNHAVFAFLHQRRDQIEERFGGPLVWNAKPDVKRCSVGVQTEVGYADPESDWPDTQRQMALTMVRLVAALEPHLAAAVESAPDAG
jgi:hypothetical protein